jgi:UDP-glucose 4-epimerase
MRIIVTGGAGYIGSHTCVDLQLAGHELLVVDNLCNSDASSLDAVGKITGTRPVLVVADIRDKDRLDTCMRDFAPEAVIHFAALKAVGKSCEEPLRYYENNLAGTLELLAAMQRHGCRRIVFSSSATVYGAPERCPVDESAPLQAMSPYGRTKLMMEQVIGDLTQADPGFHAAVLRYFNPAGAHPSGLIGEFPRGTPNNLVPFVSQVAAGLRPGVSVFGNDFPTIDGTGVRDYIHVCDLASAHVAALGRLVSHPASFVVNVGTGRGYSVLEVIAAFERAAGRPIGWKFAPRRAGDVAECFADPSLANRLIGWKADLDLARMCEDAWRWQQGLAGGNRDS